MTRYAEILFRSNGNWYTWLKCLWINWICWRCCFPSFVYLSRFIIFGKICRDIRSALFKLTLRTFIWIWYKSRDCIRRYKMGCNNGSNQLTTALAQVDFLPHSCWTQQKSINTNIVECSRSCFHFFFSVRFSFVFRPLDTTTKFNVIHVIDNRAVTFSFAQSICYRGLLVWMHFILHLMLPFQFQLFFWCSDFDAI